MTRVNTKQLLNLVQALGIVAGGCWIAWRYLAHEHETLHLTVEQQRLAVEQQRLANAQAAAVAATQQGTEEARLEQLRLTNRQAEIALTSQRTAQTLSLQQQRLANEQARLTLRVSETQHKVQQQELLLKGLEQSKAEHDLTYTRGYRFGSTFKIKSARVKDLGPASATYEVEYGWTFTNKSQVDFEVTLFVLDYYLGIPKPDEDASISVRSVGAPPDRWNPSSAQEGALTWRRLGTTGAIYAAALGSVVSPWDYVIQPLPLVRGGAGTGELKPEQSMEYTDTYIVRAPRDSYVGFVISWCFDRCTHNDDLYSRIDWTPVEERPTGALRRLPEGIASSPKAGDMHD